MVLKKSAIWNYFTIKSDPHFDICKLEVSRGGDNTTICNTTNIVNHLKAKHHSEYQKYGKERAAEVKGAESQMASKRVERQQLLEESKLMTKQWDINSPSAQKINFGA